MAAEDKIICLDLDGTLVNSQEAHAQSFNLAFQKNNLPIKPIDFVISKFGPPAEGVIKAIFPKISDRKLRQVIKDKRRLFVEKAASLTKEIPGVKEALEELRQDFTLVLVSNATKEEIEVTIKAAGIKKGLFAAILGYPEMHAKPDPDIIDLVEEKVDGRVEYFVGDTTNDIQTGNMAEIKTIAVLTGVHDVKTLGAEDPTIIIESVALLPEYFRGDL